MTAADLGDLSRRYRQSEKLPLRHTHAYLELTSGIVIQIPCIVMRLGQRYVFDVDENAFFAAKNDRSVHRFEVYILIGRPHYFFALHVCTFGSSYACNGVGAKSQVLAYRRYYTIRQCHLKHDIMMKMVNYIKINELTLTERLLLGEGMLYSGLDVEKTILSDVGSVTVNDVTPSK